MQILNDGKIQQIQLFVTEKKSTPRTAEEEMINKFMERLNVDRTGKYKKLSFIAVRKKLYDSEVRTQSQLYAFYKECENSRIGFSKFYWWSLKVKK